VQESEIGWEDTGEEPTAKQQRERRSASTHTHACVYNTHMRVSTHTHACVYNTHTHTHTHIHKHITGLQDSDNSAEKDDMSLRQ